MALGTHRRELIVATLFSASIVACDDGPSADADVTADADHDVVDDADEQDADEDVPDPRPSEHSSYVPEGLRPTSAARVIVIGDSIGFGRSATSEYRTFYGLLIRNDDEAYPEESGHDLGDLFGDEPELVDVATQPATTADLASQVDRLETVLDLPARGHSIVLVSVGGDDLLGAMLSGLDPAGEVLDHAVERIEQLVAWLDDQRFPDGVSIYLLAFYDPSDGVAQIPGCFDGASFPAVVTALEVWRDRYVELGRELGVAVIDAHGHFHGHAHHYDDPANPFYDPADPTPWLSDCTHPNDRGHSELRRLLYEAIDSRYVAD